MHLRIASSLLFLAALLWVVPGQTQCLGFQCPPGVLGAGNTGVSLPLDGFTTPTGAYAFRKLRSTYSGPAIRIRRASDNLETDINFLGYVPGLGAPWDEAAATAHCAATSCFVKTIYDQSGNARDLTQATPASQPSLVFGCQNGLPCIRAPGAQLLVGPSVTPATGIVSLSIVARRSAGAGICVLLRENTGNRILTHGNPATWQLQAASVTLQSTVAATEGAYHAFLGIIGGAASSIIRIDGTETNATGGTDVVAGTIAFVGAASTTCELGEAVTGQLRPDGNRAAGVGE